MSMKSLFWITFAFAVGLTFTTMWLTPDPVAADPKYERYEIRALKSELVKANGVISALMADYVEACARAMEYSGTDNCKYWQP